MAIDALLIGTQQAVFADNIVNPYMTFNNDIAYSFTSGSGNATVTNSDEKTLVGNKSMKIRALTTSGCNFNANDSFDFTIKSDGIHNIQFRAWKSDPDAIVSLVVNVFIDGVLSADRIFNALMDSDNGFQDDSWNLFYQSFSALSGDNASISFYFQSDTVDTIVYLDAFKIEANNQNQLAPSLYTDPPFLINKWSRVYNFVDEQELAEDSEYNFSLFEGVFESNCGSEILVEGLGFQPTRLNSFFTVNANFLAKVPTGTTPHLEAELFINGTIYYGDCKFLNKPVDGLEYVNFSFQIPCNQEFLDNNGTLVIIPRGNDIVISRRVFTISETVNSN
jgi:hypothetical protein